ncbi:MAG: molybdopterin-dependent oxidoreductase, partial [Chloroflexia bacterium]|nr:molybdopterin-dependent oxidoreductase [Chloroflexia bacterium]
MTRDTATAHQRVPQSAPQTEQRVGTHDEAADQVDRWLAIAPDGQVTVFSGKVELGTGIATALAQIVAAELRVPLERIDVVMGDTVRTPDQGYTAGSKTIQLAGPILGRAAAAARAVLTERAATRFGVPVERLVSGDGAVHPQGSEERAITYGELIGEGFGRAFDPDGPVPPAVEGAVSVVGQSAPRVDLLGKLTGDASFVHDLRLSGMLHGRVVRPWRRTPAGIGATVASVDESPVTGLRGLV